VRGIDHVRRDYKKRRTESCLGQVYKREPVVRYANDYNKSSRIGYFASIVVALCFQRSRREMIFARLKSDYRASRPLPVLIYYRPLVRDSVTGLRARVNRLSEKEFPDLLSGLVCNNVVVVD